MSLRLPTFKFRYHFLLALENRVIHILFIFGAPTCIDDWLRLVQANEVKRILLVLVDVI